MRRLIKSAFLLNLVTESGSIHPAYRLQKAATHAQIAEVAAALPLAADSVPVAADAAARLAKLLSAMAKAGEAREFAAHPGAGRLLDVLSLGLRPPRQVDDVARALRSLGSLAPLREEPVCVERLSELFQALEESHAAAQASETALNSGPSEAAGGLTPSQCTGLRWAAERLGILADGQPPLVAISRSADALPFRVYPACVLGGAAGDGIRGGQDGQDARANFDELRAEVEFHADTVVGASGAAVRERRLTAWQTAEWVDDGFAYSGKTMPPASFTPAVARLLDVARRATEADYDCVLLNCYPGADAGMRYHADPDQGSCWGYHTAVMSVGETRRFCFRPLAHGSSDENQQQQQGQEQEVDRKEVRKGKEGFADPKGGEVHEFRVFDGDLVHMYGDCQARFQHCVHKAEKNSGALGPRVSLVW
eukprot:CAMPEP_0172587456 /NCGR_PEP_ID=MMETSP1068-20121228/6512_1 /TAXON_ID=35684 /ORGANISM="Pseudopedinella elastica, Strain CCMP716" /LENGTH=422 /DNA_ID=CAMNT_0013382489 /DNA_START=142 /DNA_END=1407 /DNA_ORIENTATION=-